MTDESGQTYPFTIDALLSAAVGPQGYYGAYTVNAHTDTARTRSLMQSFPQHSPVECHCIKRPNVDLAGRPEQLFLRRTCLEWHCSDLYGITPGEWRKWAASHGSEQSGTSGVLDGYYGTERSGVVYGGHH